MKRLISAGLFTLVSILPAFSGLAEETTDPLANAPTRYSADLVVTRKMGPPRPMTIKVYVDVGKRRTEQGAGNGNIMILRGDLSKRYVLNPSNKTYVEAPLDPRMLESPTDWAKKMGLLHEKVGTEEVNGELCDKYRYSPDPKTANTQNRQGVTGFIWVGQTTHMLVKSENPGSTAEWKNIQLGPPDASLFEPPADYTKIEMGKPAPATPEASKPEEQKSGNPNPALKSEGQSQSPSPSPSASAASEKPDKQPSDDEKSGGNK